MKIIQICTNLSSGSVGSIVRNLYDEIVEDENECLVCYGRGRVYNEHNFLKFNNFGVYIHAYMARIFDSDGLHSKRATKKLIKVIKNFNPDIIHIHCLHGYYINYPVLFDYLNSTNIKVIWTMHDCWAFTGHCCYFDFRNCNAWKTECTSCIQKKTYPKSLFLDKSKRNFYLKKKYFNNNKNLTIITPSIWLSNLIKSSFLKNKNCKVINNGIDIEKFKPTKAEKLPYHIDTSKKIILGVASIWDDRKGISDFYELSKYIDESYQIILVGINKKMLKNIPPNIIGINRTDSIEDLAKIYSIADVFFNPTYEDNYPTVNLEAIACNTPIVTYNTGGSCEVIQKNDYGIVIEKKDFKRLIAFVDNVHNGNIQTNFSNLSSISHKAKCKEYLSVYKEVYNEN